MTASFRGFGVLAHAEFRKLFTAYSTSAVGDGLQLFALTFVVLRIGGGPAQLALVLAARQFPTVALTLLSGVWADRLERRRLLVFSDLVCGSCQLAVAAVVLTGCARVWHLALLGLVFGSARSLFVPAVAGLVPATVPADQLRQANSLMQTVRASTYVAGAPIAAFVISISSPGVAVLLDGISFMISAAFLATMRQRVAADAATPNRGMWRELRGGWHEVRSRRWLLAELLRSCIDLPLVIAPMTVLGPIIAAHRLGGVSAWAMISTAFLVGTLAGPVLAHRLRPARPMLVCTALMYIGAVSPLLLAYARWAWPIAASELVKGCVVGYFGALWATLLQQKVADNVRSRVSAWDFTLTTGLTPLGLVVVAPLTQHVGTALLLTTGSVWVLVSVTAVLCLPEIRNLTWEDDESVTESPIHVTVDERGGAVEENS